MCRDTGGVAALNRRLMAENPSGSIARLASLPFKRNGASRPAAISPRHQSRSGSLCCSASLLAMSFQKQATRRIRQTIASLGFGRLQLFSTLLKLFDSCEQKVEMSSVYIETSIVSYLRQRPATHVVTAARQLLTHQWWNDERQNYDVVVSQYVIDEGSAGDPVLAAERLESLDGIPILPAAIEIPQIASKIMASGVLPAKAQVDALHIAAVAHYRIQYLLTWNCKHIANARNLPRIHDLLNQLGIPIPIICTPEEMLGHDTDDH